MTGTSRLSATPPRPGGGADGGRPSVAPAAGQDRVRTENAFPPTESRPRAPAKGRSGHATPPGKPAAAMVHWTAMSRLRVRRGTASAVCPLGQTVSSGLWPPGRTVSQRPGAFSTVRLFHLDTAQVRPRALRAAPLACSTGSARCPFPRRLVTHRVSAGRRSGSRRSRIPRRCAAGIPPARQACVAPGRGSAGGHRVRRAGCGMWCCRGNRRQQGLRRSRSVAVHRGWANCGDRTRRGPLPAGYSAGHRT